MGTGSYEDDEGTGLVLDSGSVHAGTGWTLAMGTINQIGPVTNLHLEFSHEARAPALALTLPDSNYYPVADVHTENGDFAISAETGEITYTGDTTNANAGPIVCECVYDGRKVG